MPNKIVIGHRIIQLFVENILKDIPPPTTDLNGTPFHNVDPEQFLTSDRIQERKALNAPGAKSLQYLPKLIYFVSAADLCLMCSVLR